MAAIWDFRQSWVYSLLNEMLKLKETSVVKYLYGRNNCFWNYSVLHEDTFSDSNSIHDVESERVSLYISLRLLRRPILRKYCSYTM